MERRRGFTLLEVLIALVIMGLLVAVAWNSFAAFKRTAVLKNDAQMVHALLRDARARTIAGEEGDVYGIHFATSSVTLYKGSNYSAASASNEVHTLSAANLILSVTLMPSGNDVGFQHLSGTATRSGTVDIALRSDSSRSIRITIAKTGIAELSE